MFIKIFYANFNQISKVFSRYEIYCLDQYKTRY